MRHRWMVMLVVMVTTLTTAQEALKQYDGLKAQAEEWATLRLWTGFINAYTPQDEPLEAQEAACPASEATVAQALRQDAPAQLARQVEAQIRVGQKREAANTRASLEVSNPGDEHHMDAVEATESAFEHMGEVALLAEPNEALTEETMERVTEAAEQVGPNDDGPEEITAVHTLQRIRVVSRARNQEPDSVAPLAATEDDAALRRARVASRADAQAKAKAIRRAIRVMQIQLERSTKIELRTDKRDSSVEPSKEINAAPSITISLAADARSAPQDRIRSQAPASIDGECSSE